MFSETYRSINQPVAPSPALVAETLARTRRYSRSLPRRVTLIAAVLAVFLATPALAARTNPGYQLLYAISPAAAQFFQPVRMRCTDSGVTMEVQSVRVEADTAQAYVSLTGEMVDGTCDLYDSWDFHLPFDQTGTCSQVDYDAATHTATFLCTTQTMDGSPIPQGGKMTFSVREFLSGKEVVEDLTVDLDLTDYGADAALIRVPGQPEGTDVYVRTGGGGAAYDRYGETSPMLLPQSEPLAVPVEGILITAAGYADGLFHIQAESENKLETDNHCWLWLEAPLFAAAANSGGTMTSMFSISPPPTWKITRSTVISAPSPAALPDIGALHFPWKTPDPAMEQSGHPERCCPYRNLNGF